jgi:hypothetical protein
MKEFTMMFNGPECVEAVLRSRFMPQQRDERRAFSIGYAVVIVVCARSKTQALPNSGNSFLDISSVDFYRYPSANLIVATAKELVQLLDVLQYPYGIEIGSISGLKSNFVQCT